MTGVDNVEVQREAVIAKALAQKALGRMKVESEGFHLLSTNLVTITPSPRLWLTTCSSLQQTLITPATEASNLTSPPIVIPTAFSVCHHGRH